MLGSRELSPRNRFPGHSSLGTRSPLPPNYGVFFIWSLSNLSLLSHFRSAILFSPMFCLKKNSIVEFKDSWVYFYNWDIFEAVLQYIRILPFCIMLYVSKLHLLIKQTLHVSISYLETFGHTNKLSWSYEDYAYTRYFLYLAKMVKPFY